MKHYRPLRRIVSFVLCMFLLCGLSLSTRASAFEWPNSFWAVHNAWVSATAAKDPDQIISVVTETYDLLMTYERNTVVYSNLEFKCGWAALCCEMKGDLKGAIQWLERQQALCQWLTDNGEDRKDTLLNIEPRLVFLRTAANPVIYALSDDAESPYAYGPRHGTWHGSIATEDAAKSGESAVLVYIHFFDGYSVEYWLDYFKNTYPEFKKAAAQNGVIELAWNFKPENTASVRKVLDPASDVYINEGLKAISQLNATVLLRVGAEMNVWAEDCDPAVFRAAYQKIAAEARKYPNIQLSWSPTDVGNRNHTWDDFWPGDEYVDWVGMSSYRNSGTFYSYGTTTPASYSLDYQNYIYDDAYYGVGVYSTNPLAPIKSLVDFAAAHNKPVMISECGSAYYNKTTGKDQTAFAAKTLTTFYSYVNMIYPQVKAVFYFNQDSPAASYRLDGNAAVNSAYDAVTKNGSYLSFGQTDCMNWETLDKTTLSSGSGSGKLTLATYAMLPGSASASTSVSYFVDGKQVGSASAAPYLCELDLSALSAGQHTVQAEATCTDGSMRATVKTAAYTLDVPGAAAPEKPAQITFTDVPDYFMESVSWAVDKKITNGYDATTFGSNDNCNQAQILTFLWRAKGSPEPTIANPFGNLDTAQYYAKPAIWAYEQGLISGSSFDANGVCTRGNVVTYLWKLAGCPKTGAASAFTDVPAQLADAVAWAAAQGITQGIGDGLFGTNNSCTRGQIVTFLYRAYK